MSVASDEAAARSYLRLLVGAPEGAANAAQSTELEFIAVAARWAERTGVDRQTLVRLGVPKNVLDRAGIIQVPIEALVRRFYSTTPFDVATLARRSCVSEGSVRQALANDERTARVQRVASAGRAVMWRRVGR